MYRDQTELIIGDDNLLMLTINAANEGEGAYEAELHVTLPPEADYIGVERRREVNNINHYSMYMLTLVKWWCCEMFVPGWHVKGGFYSSTAGLVA